MRTLKDITQVIALKSLDRKYIEYDALRNLAIEWLKKFSKPNSSFMEEYEALGDYQDSGYGEYTDNKYGCVENWIIHFFNITQKELKEIYGDK